MRYKITIVVLIVIIIGLSARYGVQSNKIKDLQWQSEVIKMNYNDLVDKYRITIQSQEVQ